MKNFDDEISLVVRALENRARLLSDVLFEYSKMLTTSDELYELDKREQQLNELNKLIKKLKNGNK